MLTMEADPRHVDADDVDILECVISREEAGEYVCVICQKLLQTPYHCPDDHNFCQVCIEAWLVKKEHCPICRVSLTKADLGRALFVERLSRKLEMRCPHKACVWTGEVGEFEEHTADEHTRAPCPCEGCPVRVVPRRLLAHMESCGYRGEMCECKLVIAVAQREQHNQVCPMADVPCSLGCGARHLRKDTGAHEQVCPEMPVECEYKRCGCTVGTMLRKDAAAHERDAAAHATSLWLEVKSQQQRIAGLRQRERALHEAQRRVSLRSTLPVVVRWVIEDARAKFSAQCELPSRQAVVQSPDGCRQPINLKLKAVFVKDYLGLYIRNDGSDSGYNGRVCLDGATITLKGRKASDNIVKKFQAEDRPEANRSVGFTRVASRADVQRWYLAADGSLTVLASLCARCTEEVMCV